MVAETLKTGIGMNMAPWNFGSMYINDPQKAATSLGAGTYINYTDQNGNTTLYQVQDGKFIKAGCTNSSGCELTNTSGGTFQVVNVKMM